MRLIIILTLIGTLGCSSDQDKPLTGGLDLATLETPAAVGGRTTVSNVAKCMPEKPGPVGDSQVLMEAIGKCDLPLLTSAIASGVDVNGLLQGGRTLLMPLAMAMRECKKNPDFRLEAVKALYEAGAAPHLTPHDFDPGFGASKTSFEGAIATRSPELLEVLLQDPERIVCLDKYGASPLEKALVSLQRDIKRMKQYPGARATLKLEALEPAWDILLSPRVMKEVLPKMEPQRLRRFILEGDVDLLTRLQKHGYDIEGTAGEDGRSLAHHAVTYPDVGSNPLAALAESGISLTRKDSAGITPLMLAALHGKTEMIRILLERDAGVKAVSRNGLSAMSFARLAGHDEIAKLLEESGGNDPRTTKVPPADQPRLRLPGDPAMNALDAITNYEGYKHAFPNQLDKDGSTVINHGSIHFKLGTTVEQVNQVLESRGARIGSSLQGVLELLVSIPQQPEAVDAEEVKREFEAFAQVRSYSPDHVMSYGPKYVSYESCPDAAKKVIDKKGVSHSEIAGCSSEQFALKGTGFVDHVIVSHGKGMDCPSGCFYERLAVVVDPNGRMLEPPRRPDRVFRSEVDLARSALEIWVYHRKTSASPEAKNIITLVNRAECADLKAPVHKPELLSSPTGLHWRMTLSRTYDCWAMGHTTANDHGTQKLSFQVSGALTILRDLDGGRVERNLDDLLVREVAGK